MNYVVPKQLIAISKNEQRVNPAAKRYRPGVVPEFARDGMPAFIILVHIFYLYVSSCFSFDRI
jgi:hypothetical protein